MTRAFLKMARAQAALTAYRKALEILRRLPAKEAERKLLEKIRSKRPPLEDWRRQKEAERMAAAEAGYRKANAALMDE
jgi:hypothetical protein